ncbi:neprilysin-4 isoform X1 [Cryptotermes secundus]|nr:neprilysin-4 isoform X1 [Cryptotermes secundus]
MKAEPHHGCYRSSCLVKLHFIASLTLPYIFAVEANHGDRAFLPWPLEITKHDRSRVCETEECKVAATQLLHSLNMSVDPCEDFYEFACGGWMKLHPVPPSESHRNQFDLVMEKVDFELKEILEAGDDPDEPFPVRAAKRTYQACMDTDYVESEGLEPLLDIIESLGDWPMASDTWKEEDFNWQKAIAELNRHLGLSPLVSLIVYLDRKNSTHSVITIDQSSPVLPRSMLADPNTYGKQLEAYRQWIMGTAIEVVKARNASVPPTRISVDASEVLEFEIELAHVTTPTEKRRNAYRMYNPMTLEALQNLTDSVQISSPHAKIHWQDFFEAVFTDIDVTFNSQERVVVKEVQYLLDLVTVLDHTPLRVIANYIQWRLVKALSKETTQKMRELSFQFERVYSGTKEKLPLWRECTFVTTSSLSFAVGYSYVSRFFDNEAKKSALQMVENIRAQFSSSVSEVDWMDPVTRKVAQAKAQAMKELIGYPDWYANKSAIEAYYKGVSVGRSHLRNIVSLKTLMMHRVLSKLHLPTDRSEWYTSPDVVNAYYNPQTNSITFPAGILQLPFFSKGRPEALNYGSIGVVIGHEITHGFDDMGRQSDKYGNLAQWWSKSTIHTYLEKAQCFIEQYSMYRVPELDELLHTEVMMNGVTTQGENMADNGGMRQAFLAYKKYVEHNGPDLRLPGLHQFSPEQLFFLGFATVWCESATKESLLQEVLSDPHSPQRLRVQGTLANSQEFAHAWDCPVGSPMNPRDKCLIW